MHDARAGETQRLTSQALEARAQGEVLTLDLLHHQLLHRMLLGREMSLIDTRFVRVVTCDAKGCEQGAEFQKLCILPSANDVREYSPGAMINRMPQPPCLLFGADETPHFIELGGASYWDANVA